MTETCTECGKPFQHDQYYFWCNECGEKIETELIERLPDEQTVYGIDCPTGKCEWWGGMP